MLMTVRPIEQRSRRTDFNAVAALGTIQPSAIGADDRIRTAIAGLDRLLTHPLVADTRATFAENAALRVVCDHRRKIFFRMIVFLFRESLFQVAPVKSLLLQLALSTTIANGAVQRMIREQKLKHRTLRFLNLFALRGDDHAVSAGDG